MNDDRSHVVAAILAIALFAAFVGGLAVAVLWYATADAADYATEYDRVFRGLKRLTITSDDLACAHTTYPGADASPVQLQTWMLAVLETCMKEID